MSAGVTRALLRADGSAELGLGHLMRSLTLGEALVARGWFVTLVTAELPPEVAARARSRSIGVHHEALDAGGPADAAAVAALARDVVVVDGYHFDESFYSVLAALGCPHVVIDDNDDTPATSAAIVVNQNPHARPEMYEHLNGRSQLLLGLDYVLLRSEMGAARQQHRREGRPRVFVSMGGSDTLGLTAPLAESLDRLGVSVRVALGAANPERRTVAARLAGFSSVTVVRPESFAAELAGSDVAVIGAGTTMWEAALLGVPAIGVVVADNQAVPSAAAADLGFVRRVDGRTGIGPDAVAEMVSGLLADPESRAEMSRRGRASVDGRGAQRVAGALESCGEVSRWCPSNP